MAFNGSGVFARLHSWAQDRANALRIRADRMDAEMDGFATGLSNCITRDGQSTVTADIPMNSRKFTGLAAGANSGDSVRFEQISDLSAAEVTVASAETCNILGAASERAAISGTTTITSFGTGTNRIRFVRATGAFTITHDGTSLICPGGSDITTVAGDTFIVSSDAGSNARILHYQRGADAAARASFSVHKNGTDQNISSTDVTLVTWSTEARDVGSCFASNAWTPPAGEVVLHAQMRFRNLGGSTASMYIYKNGTRFRTRFGGGTGNLSSGQQDLSIHARDVADGTDSYDARVQSADDSYLVDGTADLTLFEGASV